MIVNAFCWQCFRADRRLRIPILISVTAGTLPPGGDWAIKPVRRGAVSLPGGQQAKTVRSQQTYLPLTGAGFEFGRLAGGRRENNAGFAAFLPELLQQFEVTF